MRRLAVLPTLLALTALACNTFFPPRPEAAWDADPANRVIELYTAGGMVPNLYMDNYIPTARVWGDGRMIWTTFADGGGRQVWTGQLTPDQLRSLLQRFVDAGFFGWQAHYEPPYQVYDAGSTVLTVNLLSGSKTVSEYFQGAPEQFHTLGGVLASGAGLTGQEFTPDRAYLHAYPQSGGSAPIQRTWPDEQVGFTLAEAADPGRYIEGEALRFAWAAVNAEQFGLIVSAGQVYQITLQVPGVSFVEPEK